MILLLALPSSSSSGSIARPGCPGRCGSLKIPYPFGVGPGCSMGPSFEINCNVSYNLPKAYLPSMNSEIIERNRSIIRVKSWKVAFSSYGEGGLQFKRLHFNFSATQYTFSDHNWLTAIGCDDGVAMIGLANKRSFGGSCISFCRSWNDSGGVAFCANDNNGYGFETGCCQTPIPKGLGIGLGFITIIAICLMLCTVFQKRKKRINEEKFFSYLLSQHETNGGMLEKTEFFPAKFNFSENRILGQGTQGIVYKGMLSNGKIVAIKRLKLVDENQVKQLINEVVILSQINHKNVVKLLGCCLATEVPLIVYEFISHGTLFGFLHDPNTEIPLSWNMRLKIAADITGALAYLYHASSVPIYDRNMKSTNILLDEKFIVKISDFGIPRVVAVDETHINTEVRWTFGYFDPEYCRLGKFTEKVDVYSFGVVINELLTR